MAASLVQKQWWRSAFFEFWVIVLSRLSTEAADVTES
jgi:hypothetical protein